MSYDRLTAIIVEATKGLKAKNNRKLNAPEKENAELKQRLAKLDVLADRRKKRWRSRRGSSTGWLDGKARRFAGHELRKCDAAA